MPKIDLDALNLFTGTEHYYRISRKHLLTDGAKYLAELADCFWMMDAIASHLAEIGTADWFVVVKVIVRKSAALMIYDDGNGHEHARQEIPYWQPIVGSNFQCKNHKYRHIPVIV